MSDLAYGHLNLDFNSIEEYIRAIKEFDLEAIQVSSGSYSNQHKILELPKMQLGLRSMSCATIHNGVLLSDAFYFVIPKDNLQTFVNGKIVSLSQLIIIRPGEEVSTIFANNFSAAVLSISTTAIKQYIGENALKLLLKHSELYRYENIAAPSFLSLNQNLYSVVHSAVINHQFLSDQSLLDVQETVFSILDKFLFSMLDLQTNLNVKRNNYYEITKRAFKYLREVEHIDITIPELSQICFCSTRNLEYAFKNIVQMTPKQFLVKRRLNIIHNLLRTSQNIFIKDVVSSFGIVNIGRFSRDYYNMFGQHPNETLKQS